MYDEYVGEAFLFSQVAAAVFVLTMHPTLTDVLTVASLIAGISVVAVAIQESSVAPLAAEFMFPVFFVGVPFATGAILMRGALFYGLLPAAVAGFVSMLLGPLSSVAVFSLPQMADYVRLRS